MDGVLGNRTIDTGQTPLLLLLSGTAVLYDRLYRLTRKSWLNLAVLPTTDSRIVVY